jgi:release factor glutamine methyltransferase
MAQDRPWTTLRLLNWTTEHFTKKGIDSPRVSAEMLLSHVLESTRIKLYTETERVASELERAAFRDLVERASKNEPVDYLIGKAPFFSMMLKVSPAVLVPRPSTETIVEHVLQHARRTPGFTDPLIADICTGSGAIAIALAKHLPSSRIIATDISGPALEIARENARDNKVDDRIEFRQADFLQAITSEKFQYLISNPPYISDAEWADVPPNVKDFEPTLALRGGPDGLKFIRPLIAEAHKHLLHPGQLLIEVAASHKDKVLDLCRQNPNLENGQILADHEGLPRVLVADRAPINPLDQA